MLRLLQHHLQQHQVRMQRVKESVYDYSMIGSRAQKTLQCFLTIQYYDHVSFCKSVKAINSHEESAHNTTQNMTLIERETRCVSQQSQTGSFHCTCQLSQNTEHNTADKGEWHLSGHWCVLLEREGLVSQLQMQPPNPHLLEFSNFWVLKISVNL